jgi:hypothetical protein
VPECPDQDRGQQRGVERVAHGIGHRQVQRVALDAEVERVSPYVAGRLEPPGQSELAGLAGVGAGQQPVLDLRLQGKWQRALPPLVEIREAAVGDHDVGKRVRRAHDDVEGLIVGRVGQPQLEDPDRFAAARDRGEQPAAALLRDDLDLLPGKSSPLRRPGERHDLGALTTGAAVAAATTDVPQTNERPTAVVGNEEADVPRTDRLGQRGAEHLGRPDGRGRLDRR